MCCEALPVKIESFVVNMPDNSVNPSSKNAISKCISLIYVFELWIFFLEKCYRMCRFISKTCEFHAFSFFIFGDSVRLLLVFTLPARDKLEFIYQQT